MLKNSKLKLMRSLSLSQAEQSAVVDWLLSVEIKSADGLLETSEFTSEVETETIVRKAPAFFLSVARELHLAEQEKESAQSIAPQYPTLTVVTTNEIDSELPESAEEEAMCKASGLSFSMLEAVNAAVNRIVFDSESTIEPKNDPIFVLDKPAGGLPKPVVEKLSKRFTNVNHGISAELDFEIRDWFDPGWRINLISKDNNLARRLVSVIQRLVQSLLNEYHTASNRLDDKLAAMKQLCYGASHEFNNPLANIATRAQTLARDEENPDRKQMLQVINAQAFRGFDMLANLMHFASPPNPSHEVIDAMEISRRAISEIKAFFAAACSTDFLLQGPADTEADLNLEADVQHLLLLLKAALRNAVEAKSDEVVLSVQRCQLPDGEAGIQFAVSDFGQVVDQSLMTKMVDPFFSGREAGRGLGFGLSLAYQIVRQHRGQMVLAARRPRGMVVSVRLPEKNVWK